MSTESNVYSQGGGGTSYEFEVQTAYMIQLLIGGTVPGIANSHIDSIRFQSGSLGYKTDDLLIGCSDTAGTRPKVLFQIKHTLTISEKNAQFCEVLQNCWKDFSNKKLFNPLVDKIYIIKSYLTSDEKKHLKTICNWAKVKNTTADFINEVNRIAAKKTYFEIFKSILNQKRKKSVTNDDLFKLFFCLDFIEYDFGEASSTAKANFLTILEHTKDISCTLTSDQIWDSILSYVSHADNKGGSFNAANPPVQLKQFFKNGYYSSVQKSLLNLSNQSFEIIDIIKDNIGNAVLQRPEYLEKITSLVNSETITIITGEPGSGKSVLAKQFISTLTKCNNAFVIVFKADELNKINLKDYFLKYNIQLTVKEVFSFFPLNCDNYIYIDSFEKLLEGDGDAFRQIQKICTSESRTKIIATCREADLPLIRIKYLSENKTEPVKIQLLSDEELSLLEHSLPSLTGILKNKRIHSLLKTPKYLDFAYRAHQVTGNDFSDTDEPGFMQHLWNIIVENRLDDNKLGMPERRNTQFIDLAVQRAKSMLPYIIPANPDLEALANLEKGAVITKSLATDAFTPAHDILEDWALIKHVDKIFFQDKIALSFFNTLGREPAMRRAFRLWTLQAFKKGDEEKISILTQLLIRTDVGNYWQDESVIALLQTPFLKKFLELHSHLLWENEGALFFKLVHLMRTSCREYETIDFLGGRKFIPMGESWDHIIAFISQHLSKIPVSKYDLVLHTIDDWHFILYKYNDLVDTSEKAGSIITYLLETHYFQEDTYGNSNGLLCTRLLLDCSGGKVNEVTELIKKASSKYEKDDSNVENERQRIRVYKKLVETTLTGPCSTQVAKYLPQTLLALLKKEWFFYETEEEEEDYADSPFRFKSRRYRSDDNNIKFGIASEFKRDYFPASAYQTPIYWLLKSKPVETVDFIIDLFNHSVAAFVKSDYALSDARDEVTIYLPEGKTKLQHGSSGLWCMYRGTGITTPYLLQSVLMALEKYLLEVAKEGLVQKDFLLSLVECLITKSNTVSLTAVVASLAQAYPVMIGKWIVCLFSSRKMMYWDITRYREDTSPFHLMQRGDKKVFQRERIDSGNLPHRIKYQYGLKGFIISYCFDVREYNKEIFDLLDKMKKTAGKKDWEWKKILNDIDIRNWRITSKNIQEDKIEFKIEPVHKGRLKKQVEVMKEEMIDYVDSSTQTNWMLKVNEEKEIPDLIKLREIIKYYQQHTELNPLHHHPGLAASIMVRYFWKDLTGEERQWAFDTISNIITRLIKKERSFEYPTLDISPFDNEVVMEVLPLLLNAEAVDKSDYLKFLTDILFATVNEDSIWYNKFLESISKVLWVTNPDEALQLFMGLIGFAKIEKNNPFHRRRVPNEIEMESYNTSIADLIKRITENAVTENLEDVDFKKYSQWILLRAIRIIPTHNTPQFCKEFLLKTLNLIAIYNQTKKGYSNDEDTLSFHIRLDCEAKLAQVILWNAENGGKEILEKVIDLNYQYWDVNFADQEARMETMGMFRDVLKNIIRAADGCLPENDEAKLNNTIRCFEIIWKEYFRILLHKPTILSGDLLFLNIDWNETSSHWKPLEVMEAFFKKLILVAGGLYPNAVANLLSHIGDRTLLPEGLNMLWESMQKNPERPPMRSINHIEQLVNRVYNNHLNTLKAHPATLANYISLLDELVKEGSSDAYWIREYLISFR